MMLGNLLIFCLLLLQVSAVPAPEPEPNINVKIDINVDGNSISGGGNSNGDNNDVKCGIESPSASRIINGEPVNSASKYSWQVGLSPINNPNYYAVSCGGSIITNKHILTAAHCWSNGRGPFYVGIGSNKKNETRFLFQIETAYIYGSYDSSTMDNDIAILELSQPIDLLKNGISPICIPKDDTKTYAGAIATVSGWGSVMGYNPKPTPVPTPGRVDFPNILQEAQVPVTSNTQCQQDYINFTDISITEQMLCAGDLKGFLKGGKDSCQGDSGGPLTLQDNGQYQQIGVVSFGEGCASKGIPGIYTRVTKFLNWINDVVKPEKVYTAS